MKIVAGIIVVLVAVALLRGFVSRSERYPQGPVADRPTEDSVRELLLRGRKIEAIKAYRAVHGVGLKEAKEAVERLARQLPSSR